MPRQMVDFSEIQNPMLKFLLDDGTEINVKVALMRVTRTDNKLPDGQFAHEFQFQHMIDQIAPGGEIDQIAPGGEIDIKSLTGEKTK